MRENCKSLHYWKVIALIVVVAVFFFDKSSTELFWNFTPCSKDHRTKIGFS